MLIFLPFLQTVHAVPLQLTQQGRLLEPGGAAVSGLHDLHFRLYDEASAGSLLWEESIPVSFVNGYYAAILGADESANPLDADTLSLFPLYLELELDSNGPMAPRQAVNSAPYAQLAGTARDLDGGSVDASSVSIGGLQVIDSTGSWTGTLSVDWNSQLANIPGDIADGDDNTQLGSTDVLGYVEGAVLDLQAGSAVGGSPIVTDATDSDALMDISCSLPGDVPKWDGFSWYCGADDVLAEVDVENYIANEAIDLFAGSSMDGSELLTQDTVLQPDWVDVQTRPSGLDDGDDDTLGTLNCADGESPVWDAGGGQWICAEPSGGGGSYYLGDISFSSAEAIDYFCQQYTGIYGSAVIRGSLADVDGLSCLTFIDGDLEIKQTDFLANVDGLSSLQRIGGLLYIYENHSLQNIDGLSNVETIGQDTDIEYNAVLVNLDGLQGMVSIGGHLHIENNDILEDLDGLGQLEVLGDEIFIGYNDGLLQADGFGSLSSLGGQIYFYGNNQLATVDGFNSLAAIPGSLRFKDQLQLQAVSGFSGLTSIEGDLVFDNCDGGGDFAGFPALEGISGNLNIAHSDLTAMSGLPALQSIGGYLLVHYTTLGSITGLSSVSSIGGDFHIAENGILPSSQVQALLDSIGSSNIGGGVYTANNG
jgi:hypothetical protein